MAERVQLMGARHTTDTPSSPNAHGTFRRDPLGLVRDLLRNRWMGLAAASWVESCAGVAYMFSLYSQSFKDNLGYNQTMVDMVGLAKDLGGNVGIVSGFVGDLAPPWVVLAIGAAQNAFGYLTTWLILTGRVRDVPFWAVLVCICIGTNGATFFNTGGLVTCVKNFPASRGPIVGLLKGFIGLSGALFTQLYLALYAPDKDSFLLMTSWFPSLIALLSMPAIHNLPSPSLDPHERTNLFYILICSVSTALFLLGATLLDHFVEVSRWVSLSVAVVVLVALASPSLVAWKQVEKVKSLEHQMAHAGGAAAGVGCAADAAQLEGGAHETDQLLLGQARQFYSSSRDWSSTSEQNKTGHTKQLRQRSPGLGNAEEEADSTGQEPHSFLEDASKKLLTVSRPTKGGGGALPPSEQGQSGGVPVTAQQQQHFPQVGEDHSLLQAVRTIPFWLIFLAMTGASGSGLTAINNLGQFGRSLGYGQNEIGIFVSLMSIWNFLGRVGAGYISEWFFHEKGIPRPVFMVLTQAFMALGHLIFASALPGSLYLGSVIVGLSYGSQWGLMPAVASEIFGLKYFGTLYNWLTITNPTGSYFLSVCVAGYLYDYEAEKEASSLAPAPLAPSPAGSFAPPGAPRACHGAHCFRETFLIMAMSCVVAAVLSSVLSYVTSRYYSDEYNRQKALVVSRVDSEILSGTG